MKEIAILLLSLYLLLAGAMFFLQRSFMYFPDRQNLGSPTAPLRIVKVRTADGYELSGWFVPPAEESKPVIILFHGNAGNTSHREGKARFFLERGYGFLLAEYRGYGGNPGQPTEQGLYSDARAWVGSVKEYPLVFWGESLGSGVATQMATEFDIQALILEAPFTRAADVGQRVYPFLPVSLLIRDRYDNASKIRGINAPLLVVHGEFDDVVPMSLGQKLFAEAREPKTFKALPEAGHNNMMDFGLARIIADWLFDATYPDPRIQK